MMLKYAALALVLGATLAATAACGGNSGTKGAPTSRPTAFATSSPESGRAPIFWRTADNFQSLQAGQPYKVLLRITNGYAEPTLTVTAVCQSCPQTSDRQPIAMEARKTEPTGADAPGSYYPLNLNLPAAGRWALEVVAGNDRIRILVDALPG